MQTLKVPGPALANSNTGLRLRAALAVTLALLMTQTDACEVKYRTAVDVSTRDGCAYVAIKYENIGSATMYFSPEIPMIGVLSPAKKHMRYIGVIAEYPPWTYEDFFQVAPGETWVREVPLSSYGLKKAGTYVVKVNAGYVDRIAERMYEHGTILREFYYAGNCESTY